MIVSLIVAVDEEWGIGKENRLPWRLSADLKTFKNLTLGHHLIMGRKTYETIGRPLPGRVSLVVSRNLQYPAPGCLVVGSLEQALQLARQANETEAFVIGGGELYRQAIDLTDRIYLTRVHTRCAADVFFPKIELQDWVEKESAFHAADEKNQYAFTFAVLERIEKKP